MPPDNAEAFGIDAGFKRTEQHLDHLTILVKELAKDTGALLRHVDQLRRHLHRLEIAVPDQFDSLRQLIASGQQAAKDEAVQVNAKLDELNALIQQLQTGQPVPQDVVDSMTELIEEVKTILPDAAPQPAPTRR